MYQKASTKFSEDTNILSMTVIAIKRYNDLQRRWKKKYVIKGNVVKQHLRVNGNERLTTWKGKGNTTIWNVQILGMYANKQHKTETRVGIIK